MKLSFVLPLAIVVVIIIVFLTTGILIVASDFVDDLNIFIAFVIVLGFLLRVV